MKNGLVKRFVVVAMACMMVLGISVMAFADEDKAEDYVQATDSVSRVSKMVAAWSSGEIDCRLDSYLGITKTFCVQTQSVGNNGVVELELYKDGVLKSNGNWVMAYRILELYSSRVR